MKRPHPGGPSSVVLAGLESAGKSALFRGLTGDAGSSEANFRGSTIMCRKCHMADCGCDLVDTPGIRLADDATTTRLALDAMREADVVLLVARGTHIASELETLLRELDLQQKRTALAITFRDKAPEQIKAFARNCRESLGIPVVIVNARKLDAPARQNILRAIEEAKEIPQTARLTMPTRSEVPVSRQRVLLGDVSAALRQQMFFWGRDVLTDGNLLLRHGFAKLPSAGLKGTSCYRIPYQDGVIELHGACAGWYPDSRSQRPGFLFVRPTGRCSGHHMHEPVVPGHHDVRDLQGDTATTMTAARTFISWLAAYEAWILSEKGVRYRSQCRHMLIQMPKGKPWLPAEQALAWMQSFVMQGPATHRSKHLLMAGRSKQQR